ncbi:hypothetical protein PO124_21920 [Bacillus licheniformis]|nr:hypothetical protein [Bacillus licheniformis]
MRLKYPDHRDNGLYRCTGCTGGKAGASYVAPYVNRIDQEYGNGAGVVKRLSAYSTHTV